MRGEKNAKEESTEKEGKKARDQTLENSFAWEVEKDKGGGGQVAPEIGEGREGQSPEEQWMPGEMLQKGVGGVEIQPII